MVPTRKRYGPLGMGISILGQVLRGAMCGFSVLYRLYGKHSRI